MGDYRYRVGNFECGFYGEEEPLSSHAVLGEEADTEKCLLCKNLSAENICRVLRRKKSNCDWFEEATLEYGEY